MPAAGAGNIEVPGARDVYTFTATAGTVVFVDEQAVSGGTVGITYTMTAPSSATLLTAALGGADSGQVTLPETGTYTLRVGADANDGMGTYGFTITAVP